MNYMIAYRNDAGSKRKNNQDSLCVLEYEKAKQHAVLCAVCDGMGGLSHGEIASSSTIIRIKQWFEQQVEQALFEQSAQELKQSLKQLLHTINEAIYTYGNSQQIQLGTTCTILLCLDHLGIITAHIGDSRIYQIDTEVKQLTNDHTWVAQALRDGTLTKEQAKTDRRRNVLLQCIGASEDITVEFGELPLEKQKAYVLCSDGFRHKITDTELLDCLNPQTCTEQPVLERNLQRLLDLNTYRKETDNISAICIQTR